MTPPWLSKMLIEGKNHKGEKNILREEDSIRTKSPRLEVGAFVNLDAKELSKLRLLRITRKFREEVCNNLKQIKEDREI